jgi:hypothetical protein
MRSEDPLIERVFAELPAEHSIIDRLVGARFIPKADNPLSRKLDVELTLAPFAMMRYEWHHVPESNTFAWISEYQQC